MEISARRVRRNTKRGEVEEGREDEEVYREGS